MKKGRRAYSLFTGTLVVLTVGMLTACTAGAEPEVSYGNATRAVIYESLDQLLGDASLVVTGTVTAVRLEEGSEDKGTPPLSVFTFRVAESVAPPGLADGLDDLGIVPMTVKSETDIDVLQYGTTAAEAGDTARLQVGESYLLILNPTMLPGDHADDWYITGVEAGMYISDGLSLQGEGIYANLSSEGDRVPPNLTLGELR